MNPILSRLVIAVGLAAAACAGGTDPLGPTTEPTTDALASEVSAEMPATAETAVTGDPGTPPLDVPAPGDAAADVLSPSDTPAGTQVSEKVGPQGLVLTLGEVTLTIPAGALAEGTEVTLARTQQTVPGGAPMFTDLYEFLPHGLAFLTPATVDFSYTGNDTLAAIAWGPGADEPFALLNATVGSGHAVATIDHFSRGAVVDGPAFTAKPELDAGPTDAGAPDAGPADVGPTDAGPTDSALADPGPDVATADDPVPVDTAPGDTGIGPDTNTSADVGGPNDDFDGDGKKNAEDNCPKHKNATQADLDTDGVGDVCDTCPGLANADQLDTDKDGIGDVCDRKASLDGTWPQSSSRRPAPNAAIGLASAYSLSTGHVSGGPTLALDCYSGVGPASVPGGSCAGACGLLYDPVKPQHDAALVPTDLVTVTVVNDGGDAVWIGLGRRIDAAASAGQRWRSEILYGSIKDDVLATFSAQNVNASALVGFAQPGVPPADLTVTGALLVDLAHVVVQDAGGPTKQLIALVRVTYDLGGKAHDHPVVVGMDPIAGNILWTLSLPASVDLSIGVSGADTGTMARMHVLSDGRIVVFHDNSLGVKPPALYEGRVPQDGKHGLLLRLPDEVHAYPIRDVAFDDADRLWMVAAETKPLGPNCPKFDDTFSRLRVFSSTWEPLVHVNAEVMIPLSVIPANSNSGRTQYGNLARGHERDGQLHVESYLTSEGKTRLRAIVLGEPPLVTAADCGEKLGLFPLDPTKVTSQGAPGACPLDEWKDRCCDEFPNASGVPAGTACSPGAAAKECRCKACMGLLDATGCSAYGYSGQRYALEVFEMDETPTGLASVSHRVVPLSRTAFFGAKRQGSIIPNESVLSLDGQGHLMFGSHFCAVVSAPNVYCSELQAYDLTRAPSEPALLWSVPAFDDPRVIVGQNVDPIAAFEGKGFASTMGRALAAGRMSLSEPAIVSRSPAIIERNPILAGPEGTNDEPDATPIVGQGLFPVGQGRLLSIYDTYDGSALPRRAAIRLFKPTDEVIGPIETHALDAPFPEVNGCNPTDTCTRLPLPGVTKDTDIFDPSLLEAAAVSGDYGLWVGCVTKQITVGASEPFPNTNDCSTPTLVGQWNDKMSKSGWTLHEMRFPLSGPSKDQYKLTIALTTEGRGVFVECRPEAILTKDVTTTFNNVVTTTRYLRCTKWNEVYVAGQGRSVDVYDVVQQRHHQGCAKIGLPAHEVIVRVKGKLPKITVTDAQGNAAIDFAGGQIARICANTTEPVQFQLTSGTGTLQAPAGTQDLDANPTIVKLPAGKCAEVTAPNGGLLTVAVSVAPTGGGLGPAQQVGLVFLDPGECAPAPGDTPGSFNLCTPPHPMALPKTESDQPAIQSPSYVAEGVALTDRSLVVADVDIQVTGLGMDLAIARHHRSARRPEGGGILGGWSLSIDQRVIPVTSPDGNATFTTIETLEKPFDLAFHDGSGRVDVFKHPGAAGTTTIQLTSSPSGLIYTPGDEVPKHYVPKGTAEVLAEVVTFTPPRGRYETLRRITLQVPKGLTGGDVHPYYVDSKQVAPTEQRFYELREPEGTRRIFNCKGQLIRVIDPRFHEIEFLYEGPLHPALKVRQLSRIIDTQHRETTVEWDAAGGGTSAWPRIARIVDPFGREVRYIYSTLANGTTVLDRVQRTFVNTGDTTLSVKQTTAYDYDAAGRLTDITYPGEIGPQWKTTYDADGRVTRQVSGLDDGQGEGPRRGEVTTLASPTPTTVVVTDGRGTARTYTLQALPNGGPNVIQSITFDKAVWDGKLDPPGLTTTAVTAAFSYTSAGLVESETGPDGTMTTTTYGAAGRMTGRTMTAPGGLPPKAWSYTYDPVCQLLTSETDPAGRKTTYIVSPELSTTAPGEQCRHLTRTRPVIDGTTYEDVYTYVKTGKRRGLMASHRVTKNGTETRKTTFSYADDDGTGGDPKTFRRGKAPMPKVGHPTETADGGPVPAGCTGVPVELRSTFETDVRGNVTKVSRLGDNGAAIVHAKKYDGKNRIVELTADPNGFANLTKTKYDARDRVVRVERTVKDNFSQLIGDQVSVSASFTPASEIFERTYDAAGREVAVLFGSGSGLDRNFELRVLDGAGNTLERMTPGAGITAALLSEVFDAVSSGAEVHSLVASLEATAPNTPEDLALRGPPLVSTLMTYDSKDVPIATRLTDRVTGSKFAVNRRIDTYRDIVDRVVVVADPRSGVDAGGTYRGFLTTHTYDGFGRVLTEAILDPKSCLGAGVPLRTTTWTGYDVDDNPAKQTVTGSDGFASVVADGTLVSECTSRKLLEQTYTYEGWGRLKTKTAFSFSRQDEAGLASPYTPGQSMTTYTHDDRNQVTQVAITDGATSTIMYTAFGASCLTTRTAPGLDNGTEERWTFDALGKVASHTTTDLGAIPVTVSEVYKRDALGRTIEVSRGDGLRMEQFGHDSLGRERGRIDEKGSAWERQYDRIGQLVFDFGRSKFDGRGTRFDNRGPYVVKEERFALGSGSLFGFTPSAVQERVEYARDAGGAVVRTWPHGRTSPIVVDQQRDAAGNVVVETSPAGITRTTEYDALGLPRSIVAAATKWTKPEDAPGGYQRAGLTQTRLFRHDGLGQLTAAQEQGTATTLRRLDSAGAILEETQEFHNLKLDPALPMTAAERTAAGLGIVRTEARYDSHGRRIHLVFAPPPAGAPPTDTKKVLSVYDALDRVTKLEIFDDTVSYDYAGDRVRKRVSTAGGGKLESLWSYDAVGNPYLLQHLNTDGGPALYESRRFFFRGEAAVQVNRAFKDDGTPIGDNFFALNVTIGNSHLPPTTNNAISSSMAGPSSYTTFPARPLPSSYTFIEYDGLGLARRSATTTYGAATGKATLQLEVNVLKGARRMERHALSWDPTLPKKLLEATHVRFTYSDDPEASDRCYETGPMARVCEVRHLMHCRVNAADATGGKCQDDGDNLYANISSYSSNPPTTTDTTLGSQTVPPANRQTWAYIHTASGRPHEGITKASPNAIGDRARHYYDLFDQLIETEDRKTILSKCNFDKCNAGTRRLVYDALGRRVFETFDTPSALPFEYPRRFIHHGEELIQETLLRFTGPKFDDAGKLVYHGTSRFVRGVRNDMPYIDGALSGELTPIDDLDGRFLAFITSDASVVPRATLIAQVDGKGVPYVGSPLKAMLRTSAADEDSPFDGSVYADGSGFQKDLHFDWVNAYWHGTTEFSAQITAARAVFDAIGYALALPVLIAAGGASIGGLIGQLAGDVVQLRQEYLQTGGLSWTSVAMVAVGSGFSFLGLRAASAFDAPRPLRAGIRGNLRARIDANRELRRVLRIEERLKHVNPNRVSFTRGQSMTELAWELRRTGDTERYNRLFGKPVFGITQDYLIEATRGTVKKFEEAIAEVAENANKIRAQAPQLAHALENRLITLRRFMFREAMKFEKSYGLFEEDIVGQFGKINEEAQELFEGGLASAADAVRDYARKNGFLDPNKLFIRVYRDARKAGASVFDLVGDAGENLRSTQRIDLRTLEGAFGTGRPLPRPMGGDGAELFDALKSESLGSGTMRLNSVDVTATNKLTAIPPGSARTGAE